MEQNPINPTQLIAALCLLAVVGIFLFGPVIAWAVHLGIPFSKWPRTRSVGFGYVGFVDIVVGFVLVVLFTIGVSAAWRVGLGDRYSKIRDSLSMSSPGDNTTATIDTNDWLQDSNGVDAPEMTDGDSEQKDEPESTEESTSTKTPKSIDPIAPLVMVTVQLASVLAAMLTIVFIVVRSGCRFENLGIRFDQFGSDLLYGVQVYFMFMPAILVLNILAGWLTETKYGHPVLELLKFAPLAAFAMAAVFAPLTEEILFRSVLIGWFESLYYGRSKLQALVFGAPIVGNDLGVDSNSIPATVTASPWTHGAAMRQTPSPPPVVNSANPYVSSYLVDSGTGVIDLTDKPVVVSTDGFPWWPAVLSGILFGLAHFSYGVSWVPLIAFGILLGRVYQIRRSLIPTIAIHLLHNSLSITAAWLSLLVAAK